MLAEIASMLQGWFVIHRFAVCSKQFRQAAQILGEMNEDRVIFIKLPPCEESRYNNYRGYDYN